MLKLVWFVNGKYLNQHWARRNVTSASTNVKRIGALNSIHIVYNIFFESKPTLSEYSLYLLKGSSTLFVKWATRQRFQSHSESPASFNYFDPLMNFLKRFITNKILWLKRINSTIKWHTFFACHFKQKISLQPDSESFPLFDFAWLFFRSVEPILFHCPITHQTP